MSLSAAYANSFIQPMKGKTTTFIVDDRYSNLQFARGALALAALAGESSVVLDVDALYSSDSDTIFQEKAAAAHILIRVPEPGTSIETEFSELLADDSSVVVVDSLNSLFHLLASGSSRSRSRKLSFALATLSYLARSGGKAVILTMYRREGFGRTGNTKSISNLSDSTASAEANGSELTLRCERGSLWPSGRFSIRIP